MRPTLESTGGGPLLGKIWGERLTDVSQILARSGRDKVLSYAKEIVSTDRQTDRPRNSNINRNRQNRLPVMSPNNNCDDRICIAHHVVATSEVLAAGRSSVLISAQ